MERTIPRHGTNRYFLVFNLYDHSHITFEEAGTGGRERFSQLENLQENHQKWLNYFMSIWGEKMLGKFQISHKFPGSGDPKETVIFVSGQLSSKFRYNRPPVTVN